MADIAEVADLEAFLMREMGSDLEAQNAELLIGIVSSEIFAEIGQLLAEGTATVNLPGTWDIDLALPQAPVVNVASVAVNGLVLATGSWHWNGRRTLRRASSLESFDSATDGYELSLRQGAQSGEGFLHWGGPASTVAVVYDFGDDSLLAGLQGTLLAVVARTMANPTQVRAETLGAYSVTYATESIGPLLTDAERRSLRRRYGVTGGTFSTRA